VQPLPAPAQDRNLMADHHDLEIAPEAESPDSPTRKLHERLHTHRTFDNEQVALNEKA
jgi:hypothetical protein